MKSPLSGCPGLFIASAPPALVVAGALARLAPAAAAQTGGVPDYGHSWRVVGAPGNAPVTLRPNGNLSGPTVTIGAVAQTYRMTTTEVTVGQWWRFVQAYAPFVAQNAASDSTLLGDYGQISFNGFFNGVPSYTLNQARVNEPISIGWRFAARYANWMHNGMALTREAFESGAYDTSTFVRDPKTGAYLDQATRSPGARFWIPSQNEWTKAAYFDPNRFGPDQPGYWRYPHRSDTAPISGDPALGGQTNANPASPATWPTGQVRPLNAGSYPTVQSPWGLLDMSGGVYEWTETLDGTWINSRYIHGSDATRGVFGSVPWDQLAWFDSRTPLSNLAGLRLASIPSPSSALALACASLAGAIVRRRRP